MTTPSHLHLHHMLQQNDAHPNLHSFPTRRSSDLDNMTIAKEEIFGPVVSAMPFEDLDEVIERANDSEYGLAAGLWTEKDRKSTRLNSSHVAISYAVFCLKKKRQPCKHQCMNND